MNHKKRWLAAVSIGAAAVLATAGCSTTSAAPDGPDGPIQLEYLGWVTGLQDSIDIWNEVNPDIQVRLTTAAGTDQGEPALRAGVQAGNAPCLAQMAYASIPNFVADDLLLPITDVAGEYEDLFLEWTWSSASAGDEVYGIPQDTGPMVMYYNQAKFEEFGIEVPTTWDEYAAAAASVKAQDPTVVIGSLGPDDPGQYAGLVAQNGGSWTSIDGDQWKVGINDPASIEVAEFWQGLVDRDEVIITPRYDGGIYSQFNEGKILSLVGASWNAGAFPANVTDQAGQWRVAQMPKWDTQATANHGGSASVVLKGCDYPAQAAEFATWLNSSEESMNILIGEGGLYPAAIEAFGFDILSEGVDYYGGQVIFDEFAASAENVDTSLTFGPTYGGTSTAYSDGIASIAAGDSTFVEVADQVQEATLAEMNDRGISATSWE